MHNSSGRRHNTEAVKCLLTPSQELIALAVAAELDLCVANDRERSAEDVHLYGVVNHQINGNHRVDSRRVAGSAFHGGAHRGKINHRGHTREVLQDDAGRAKRNIFVAGLFRAPRSELGHVIFRHQLAVTVAQHAFKQHFDRKGQAGYIPKTCLLQVFQTKHCGPPAGGVKRRAGTKSIIDACAHRDSPQGRKILSLRSRIASF